jgi:3',5'-cyclic AMP phosphodiesterase CpdA
MKRLKCLLNPAILAAAILCCLAGCATRPGNSSSHRIAVRIAVRIALLSDPHCNLKTNGEDAKFKGRFDKAIAAVNAEKVDLVLIAGDLTQDGKAAEMEEFKRQIKKFRAPVHYVPGNHDVGHKFNSGKSQGTVTAERVAFYEKQLGPSFFARRTSGIRVIGINGSILGSGLNREQAFWSLMESELSESRNLPTIVFSHYPLFVGRPDEPGGGYWNIEPEPRRRLLQLFKRAHITTMLNGHLHYTLVQRNDGILFIGTPPVSFGLPRGKQPEGWTLIQLPAQGEATFEFRNIEQP